MESATKPGTVKRARLFSRPRFLELQCGIVKEGLNVPDDLFKSELREWVFGTKDFLHRITMEQAASGIRTRGWTTITQPFVAGWISRSPRHV